MKTTESPGDDRRWFPDRLFVDQVDGETVYVMRCNGCDAREVIGKARDGLIRGMAGSSDFRGRHLKCFSMR